MIGLRRQRSEGHTARVKTGLTASVWTLCYCGVRYAVILLRCLINRIIVCNMFLYILTSTLIYELHSEIFVSYTGFKREDVVEYSWFPTLSMKYRRLNKRQASQQQKYAVWLRNSKNSKLNIFKLTVAAMNEQVVWVMSMQWNESAEVLMCDQNCTGNTFTSSHNSSRLSSGSIMFTCSYVIDVKVVNTSTDLWLSINTSALLMDRHIH